MESGEEDALRQMVIHRLANHRRASDVAQEICEKTGLGWGEAEAFVREVAVMGSLIGMRDMWLDWLE